MKFIVKINGTGVQLVPWLGGAPLFCNAREMNGKKMLLTVEPGEVVVDLSMDELREMKVFK